MLKQIYYHYFKTSFSKDEAIALLIGLGDKRVELPWDQPYPDHEDFDPVSDCAFCLMEYLLEEQEGLQVNYKLAMREKKPGKEIDEKLAEIEKFKKIQLQAEEYSCYFDDEISKGNLSAIRIFKTDDPHFKRYTIVSIYNWAKNKLGFPAGSIESFLNNTSGVLKAVGQEQKEAQPKNKASEEGELSKTKADNLYTTFAFLVEGFADKVLNCRINEELNVKNIAEAIEELATAANNKEKLGGQSVEAIKDRIEESLIIKKLKLPNK